MSTNFITSFGQRLKQSRQLRHKTQAEVAEALGVSKPLISGWENGNRIPDIYQFYQLCRLLGIRPDDLLLDADETKVGWIGGMPIAIPETQSSQLETGFRLFRLLMEDGFSISDVRNRPEFADYSEDDIYAVLSILFRSGYIQITRAPRDTHLENELLATYPGLDFVIVGATSAHIPTIIKAELIAFLAATQVFPALQARPPRVVGWGAGYTLERVAEQTIPTLFEFANTTWVALTSYPREHLNLEMHPANEIIQTMAKRHAGSKRAYLPYIGSEEQYVWPGDIPPRYFSAFIAVQTLWARMSIAFISVGGMQGISADGKRLPDNTAANYMQDHDDLADSIATEFLGLYLLDNGEKVGEMDSLERHVVQVKFEVLQKVAQDGQVYLVAAGGYKARGVEAVVRAGLAKRLIIDTEIAQYMLESQNGTHKI